MKRSASEFLAIDQDDIAYIKVKHSGIDPLCLMVDGIGFVFFGKSKTAYIPLDRVIAWHVNEQQYRTGKDKATCQELIDALKRIKEKFDSGKVEIIG